MVQKAAANLETEVTALRKIQNELATVHEQRQQALTQVNENEMVIKELGFLEDDAKVYKLIGPVLVTQDLVEVKANVNTRIEYIKADVARIDKVIKDVEKRRAEQREKVNKMQAAEVANAAAAHPGT